MPAEEKTTESANPMTMWEQWCETASKVWKRSMEGGKETFVDPFGLYQAWLKSAGEAQKLLMASNTKMLEPQEAWQSWLEAITEPWRRNVENGVDPLGIITQWLEMMEEVRAKLVAGSSIPADPFTFLKQWYDATSETWSKMVGDMIGTDNFIQASSQFLESYTSFTKTFRRASQEYFAYLQLATRSDIARVAELVINVEDKVDKLDSSLEDIEDSQGQLVTSTDLASLTDRLDGVENKLETLPGVLQQQAGIENLQQRLDRVEGKLDKLLSALEHIEAGQQTAPAVKSNNATRKPPTPRIGTTRRKADQVEAKA